MPGYDSKRLGCILQARSRRNTLQLQENHVRRHAASYASPEPPSVQQIANHDNLIRTFHKLKREQGQAPGPDQVTYDMLSHRDACQLMRELSKSVLAGEYRASTARNVSIPKSSGGKRTLKLRSILHRVIASALHEALTPFWETRFSDISHGFRPDRSVRTLLLALEQRILQQHQTTIITLDIQKAFDNVRPQDVIDIHQRHLHDEQLIALITEVLQDPRKPDNVGIDQGNAFSPLALNVILNEHLDSHVQDATNPSLLRYADDLTISARDVTECLKMVQEVTQMLEPIGLHLRAGQPTDLSQGEQVTVLGLELSLGEGIQYGIGQPAWDNLQNRLMEAHGDRNPIEMARMVIQGWIQAHAMALENVKDRLGGITAEMGFREISCKELDQWINLAREKWITFKRAQVNGFQGGSQD